MDVATVNTMELANKSLVEFGVVGAVLAIVLSAAILLVWWTLKTTAKAIHEKDAELSRVNEGRVETAEKMIETSTTLVRQMDRVLTMLNGMADMLGSCTEHRRDTDDS